MKKQIAIQMDALESIKPKTDTTLLLGVEALKRGYEVWAYHPKDLTYKNGEITAFARKVSLRNQLQDYFTVLEEKVINLREMQVVLMRQDPPFDMTYITATHLLEMLQPEVLVVNDPASVRNAPEKIFLLEKFARFTPPTMITRSVAAIEEFLSEHKDIVLKPLYGYAGQSVFRIKQGDSNLSSLLEMFFGTSGESIIAQLFLPEIKKMDKRIIVIDGKISAILGRVPASNDIRANFRVGGSGISVEATERDILIGETVGKELAARGILLAGLDVIGEYLTEVNVTCPTGLQKSNQIYGITQENLFWNAVEKRLR